MRGFFGLSVTIVPSCRPAFVDRIADVDTRSRRLATLEATTDIELLPIDGEVAAEWARLRVHLAHTGRRVNVNDLWIAATAAANRLPVVTQDDDFDALLGASGLTDGPCLTRLSPTARR